MPGTPGGRYRVILEIFRGADFSERLALTQTQNFRT